MGCPIGWGGAGTLSLVSGLGIATFVGLAIMTSSIYQRQMRSDSDPSQREAARRLRQGPRRPCDRRVVCPLRLRLFALLLLS